MTTLLIRLFVKDKENTDNTAVRAAYGTLAGGTGIFLNLFLFALKFVMGFISGSVAVTADAFNNLSDAASSVLTLFGFRMSVKPPDDDHPFGHGRVEYLIGLVIAAFILLVGLEFAKTSVGRIISPVAVQFSPIVAGSLVISILIKLWLATFYKKIGKKISSKTLEATAADSASDVIITCVAMLSVIMSGLFNIMADGYIGLVVALIVLYAGYSVAKDIIGPLLGQPPSPELVAEIEGMLLSYPEIIGVHDLIVHNYGPGRTMASAHVEVDMHSDFMVAHDAVDAAEREIEKKLSMPMVLHMDPVDSLCPETIALKEQIAALAHETNPGTTIHDFRVVRGAKFTKLIFDAAIPTNTVKTDKEIKKAIKAEIKKISQNYFAVITIDRHYL